MDFGVWFDIQTNHELHVELVNQTFYVRTLFTKKDKTTKKKCRKSCAVNIIDILVYWDRDPNFKEKNLSQITSARSHILLVFFLDNVILASIFHSGQTH